MKKRKDALELVRIEKERLNRVTGRRVRRIYERPKAEPLRVLVKRAACLASGSFFIALGCFRLL